MEDEGSISLDSKSLTNLRVVDLKEELDKRGLSKSGSKKDLIKRLKQQLEFEKLCEERKLTGSCDIKLQLDAVTEQNEFVQQYLAQQQKIYAEQQEMKRLIELEEIEKKRIEKDDNSNIEKISSESYSSLNKESDSDNIKDDKNELSIETNIESTTNDKLEERDNIPVSTQSIETNIESTIIDKLEEKGNKSISVESSKINKDQNNKISKDYDSSKDQSDALYYEPSKVDEDESHIPNYVSSKIDKDKSCIPDYKPSKIDDDENHVPDYKSSKRDEDQRVIPDSTLSGLSPEGCIDLSYTSEMEKIKFSSVPYSLSDIQLPESPSKNQRHSHHEKSKTKASLNDDDISSNSDEKSRINEKENSSCNSDLHPNGVPSSTSYLKNQSKVVVPEFSQKENNFNDKTEFKLDMHMTEEKSISSSIDTKDDVIDNKDNVDSNDKTQPIKEEKKITCTQESEPSKYESNNSHENLQQSECSSSTNDHEITSNIKMIKKNSKLTEEKEEGEESDSDNDSSPKQKRAKISRNKRYSDSNTDNSSSRDSSSSRESSSRSRESTPEQSLRRKTIIHEKKVEKDSSSDNKNATPSSTKNKSLPQKPKIKRNNVATPELFIDNSESNIEKPIRKEDKHIVSDSSKSIIQHDDSHPETSKLQKPIQMPPVKFPSRKLSIGRKKDRKSVDEDKHEEPVSKKSKWGSYTQNLQKNSINISTNSLKTLIPDFKVIHETTTINEIEEEESSHKETNLVNLPLNIIESESLDDINMSNKEENKNEEEENQEATFQGPVSNILFIQNLVRPFTLLQLKDVLKQTGNLVEENFWIDKIKSKCFVMYENEEEAIKTRQALNGTRWPPSNPKILSVEFSTLEELDLHRNPKEIVKPQSEEHTENVEILESRTIHPVEDRKKKERERKKEKERRRSSPPIREWDKDKLTQESPEREHPVKDIEKSKSSDKKEKKDTKKKSSEDTPAKLLDDLFQKTKAAPCIYWLPLTEEQVKQREEDRRLRRLERQKRNQLQEENERRNRRDRSNRRSREKENRRSASRSRSPIARRR